MEFPQRFGKYTLLKRIATGGMAEIFLASQRGMGGFEKEVVVKRLLPTHAENEELVEMFLDEARIAAVLTHPNIAQIYDLGRADDAYFIAMEYVRGVDLRRLCSQGINAGNFLPLNHAVRITAEICDALEYAHSRTGPEGEPLHIVHRDISPTNVLVTYDGGVKLVDFGIAKAANKATVTRSGQIKGKFGYMAPEQARGAEVDRRTDLFAVGINLYEITLGRRLFKFETEVETLEAIDRSEFPSPRTVEPKFPELLERVILRALARDPAARYQSARDLQIALEEFLAGAGLRSTAGMLAGYVRSLFREQMSQENEEAQRLRAMAKAAPADEPEGDAWDRVVPTRPKFREAVTTISGPPGGMDLRALASRSARAQPPLSQPPLSQPPLSQPPLSQPPASRAPAPIPDALADEGADEGDGDLGTANESPEALGLDGTEAGEGGSVNLGSADISAAELGPADSFESDDGPTQVVSAGQLTSALLASGRPAPLGPPPLGASQGGLPLAGAEPDETAVVARPPSLGAARGTPAWSSPPGAVAPVGGGRGGANRASLPPAPQAAGRGWSSAPAPVAPLSRPPGPISSRAPAAVGAEPSTPPHRAPGDGGQVRTRAPLGLGKGASASASSAAPASAAPASVSPASVGPRSAPPASVPPASVPPRSMPPAPAEASDPGRPAPASLSITKASAQAAGPGSAAAGPGPAPASAAPVAQAEAAPAVSIAKAAPAPAAEPAPYVDPWAELAARMSQPPAPVAPAVSAPVAPVPPAPATRPPTPVAPAVPPSNAPPPSAALPVAPPSTSVPTPAVEARFAAFGTPAPGLAAPTPPPRRTWAPPPPEAVEDVDVKIRKPRSYAGLVMLLVLAGAGYGLYFIMERDAGKQPDTTKTFAVAPRKIDEAFKAEGEVPALPPARKTLLSITSDPPGARVVVNANVLPELSPTAVQGVEGTWSTVRVLLPGYLPLEKRVQLAGDEAKVEFALEKGTPPLGSLTIESAPAGAEVFLNGQEVGQTPLVLAKVAARTELTLKLVKAGYHPHGVTYTVEEGKATDIGIRMVPDSGERQVGTVNVESIPLGAEIARVETDGTAKALGQTGRYPLKVSATLGNHLHLQAKAKEHLPVEATVDVKLPFYTLYLRLPAPERFTGALSVLGVRGMTVYVGNQEVGTTPIQKHVLPEGEHTLIVVDPKTNARKEITVEVQRNQTVQRSVVRDGAGFTLN